MRTYKVNDPWFNEYVFDCITLATPDQKAKLPTSLLSWTHTQEKIKRFADTATLEKKLEMLVRLGVQVSLFFAPPENMNIEQLKQAHRDYKNERRLDSVKQMLENKTFVITSQNIMAIMGVMAQNCHSETYMLNRDYSILAAEVVQLKKIFRKMKDVEWVKEAMEDQKIIFKLLMYNLMNQEFIDGGTAYKTQEILVLLYLYINRNKYMPLDKVSSHFSYLYPPRRIHVTLSDLVKSFHVIRYPRRNDFTISAMGIQALTQYIARLVNYTFNF